MQLQKQLADKDQTNLKTNSDEVAALKSTLGNHIVTFESTKKELRLLERLSEGC